MAFRKLLATTRGQSLLVNFYDMLMDSIPPPTERGEIFARLKNVLNELPDRHDDDHLISALERWIFPHAAFLHGAGPDAPIDHKHLACVLSFDHVKRLLRIPLRTRRIEPAMRDRLRVLLDCPDPPRRAFYEAAALVELHAPDHPLMVLGRDNIFWATTQEAIEEARALSGGSGAERMRDRLGLFRPNMRKEEPPVHFFLFECRRTLGELRAFMAVTCNRPTAIEGFDNDRFCHRAPACANAVLGCGRTVDLVDGEFRPGAPEVVMSGLPLGRDFRCSYIGAVFEPPRGTDRDFIEFLRADRDFAEMVATLEAASMPPLAPAGA